MKTPIQFFATVVHNTYIAKETRETTFSINNFETLQVPENSQFFQAGQFFNITIPHEDKKVMRAYSVSSSPKPLPKFKLCVKVVYKEGENGTQEKGIGSGFIDNLNIGDTVEFSGPFGHFGQKFPEKKCLMVATGTGIAPMKAIIDELSEKEFPTETTLLFGVREEEYAFYREYFESIEKTQEKFSFFLYISRPEENTIFSEKIKKGRVTEFFTNRNPDFFLDTEVLICGNPAMVKEVRKILKTEKFVDKKNICVEAY